MLSSTDENSSDLDSFGRIPHLRTKLAENTFEYRSLKNTRLYQDICYLPLAATG